MNFWTNDPVTMTRLRMEIARERRRRQWIERAFWLMTVAAVGAAAYFFPPWALLP